MPTYYFNLKGPHGRNLDPFGTELADDARAMEHARQVALELMHCRETTTRSWRLEVCDTSRKAIFELLFARVDPLLADLSTELRTMVEEARAKQGGLMDVIAEVRNSLHQLRGMLAKANGKPYLASLDGTIVASSLNRNPLKAWPPNVEFRI